MNSKIETQLQSAEAQIMRLMNLLKERNSQIKIGQQQVTAQAKRIAELETTLAAKASYIDQMEARENNNDYRDTKIKALNGQLDSLVATIGEIRNSL